MAGSEKSGYSHASDRLLENAYYILTPSDRVSGEKVEAVSELVRSISALPVVLDPQRHDYITAAISHLPHMIAYTLVNLVRDSDDAQQHMRMLAAGGFKDITRIASSSPVMWQQICDENRDHLLKIMEQYIESLQQVAHSIQKGKKTISLNFSARRRTTGTLFQNPKPRAAFVRHMKSMWTLSTNPEPLPLLPLFLPLTASALKISALSITGNSRRASCALNFMKKMPLTKR